MLLFGNGAGESQIETIVSVVLMVGATLLAVPVAIFLIEVLAAIVLSRRVVIRERSVPRDLTLSVVVLIPAHNEGGGLLPILADIQKQLRPGDRLLVIADNCTDDTATIASAGGAEVVARHDPARVGKGYALDFGLR